METYYGLIIREELRKCFLSVSLLFWVVPVAASAVPWCSASGHRYDPDPSFFKKFVFD